MKRTMKIVLIVFVLLTLLDFGYQLYYKSSPPGKVSAFLQEGTRLISSGEYDDAMTIYEEANYLAKTLDGEDRNLGIASAQNGSALIYSIRGNYHEALKLYEQNLDIYDHWIGPKSAQTCATEITTFTNIGLLHIHMGDLTIAQHYLDTAIAEIEALKTGDSCKAPFLFPKVEIISRLEYTAYFNQALLFRNLGNYEKAQEYYERVLGLKLSEIEQKHVHAQVGIAYLEQGKLDSAENHISKSENLLALGLLSLARQDFGTAIENFKERLESATQRQEVSEQFVSYVGLGLAYEGLGNYALASFHFNKANELNEKIQSLLPEQFKQTFLEAKMYSFSRKMPSEGLARVAAQIN